MSCKIYESITHNNGQTVTANLTCWKDYWLVTMWPKNYFKLEHQIRTVIAKFKNITNITTHTHTHPFNGPLSGTTRVSQYQKGKTNLDFSEARDSEWQWYRLDHMQVCTSLQTDNHANTSPLSFLQAGCPSCRPTNSVKALKASQILPL